MPEITQAPGPIADRRPGRSSRELSYFVYPSMAYLRTISRHDEGAPRDYRLSRKLIAMIQEWDRDA